MDHVLLLLGNGVVETGSYRDGYLVGLRQSMVGRRHLRDRVDMGALNCSGSAQSQEQHGNQTTRYGQRIGRNSRLPQPRETKVRKAKEETLSLIQETIDKFRSEADKLQKDADELRAAADRLEGKPAKPPARVFGTSGASATVAA